MHGTDFLANRYEFARSASPNLLSSLGTIATGALNQYERYKARGRRSVEFDSAIQGIGESAKELEEFKKQYDSMLAGGK